MTIPSFQEYLNTLGHLTQHVDPTEPSPYGDQLKAAAESLAALKELDFDALVAWVQKHPDDVPALGLAVGLGQEKLKNNLRKHFDTSGWKTLAQKEPHRLIRMLDAEFDLLRLLDEQVSQTYDFGDILIARGGSKATATTAGNSGRTLEDLVEDIAKDLGLSYEVRTQFVGKSNELGPCDLVIPTGGTQAKIMVAAKSFDSTGSKLTDAVREIQHMARVSRSNQYVMAAVDGIGWLSRKADLKRIHELWEDGEIDGMYTVATLDQFRADLYDAAVRTRIL